MKILVTGGAGFIGSNFVKYLFRNRPECRITILDKLTYAGRMENLAGLEENSRYRFIKGDICNPETVESAMKDCDYVINFAAETHVDRSIHDSGAFVRTDIEGVRILLEEFRKVSRRLFLQISTDEVYGSIESGFSKETDRLAPRSPYAASKAGGELLAMSYFTTYGIPVVITRASNNYGPFQYPEKLIPLFITNALDGQHLPLYGDGKNRRDWLFVEDHCSALLLILEKSEPGKIYNIGTGQELTNRQVTDAVLQATGAERNLVRLIQDRPGHDRRYALDTTLMKQDTGWQPLTDFNQALPETVKWYKENRSWWEKIKSGRFRQYYEMMYGNRLRESGRDLK